MDETGPGTREEFIEGGNEAWRKYVQRVRPKLIEFANGMLRPRGLARYAEEMVDATFEIAVAKCHTLDPTRRIFFWLRGVLRYKCWAEIKWNKAHPTASLDAPLGRDDGDALGSTLPNRRGDPVVELLEREASENRALLWRECWRQARAEFKSKRLLAFWMSSVDKVPTKVIAQKLGLKSPRNVDVHKSIVRKALVRAAKEMLLGPEEVAGDSVARSHPEMASPSVDVETRWRGCAPVEKLEGFAGERLSANERERVEHHLEKCKACKLWVRRARENEAVLRQGLLDVLLNWDEEKAELFDTKERQMDNDSMDVPELDDEERKRIRDWDDRSTTIFDPPQRTKRTEDERFAEVLVDLGFVPSYMVHEALVTQKFHLSKGKFVRLAALLLRDESLTVADANAAFAECRQPVRICPACRGRLGVPEGPPDEIECTHKGCRNKFDPDGEYTEV